jgi:hypothetical protein
MGVMDNLVLVLVFLTTCSGSTSILHRNDKRRNTNAVFYFRDLSVPVKKLDCLTLHYLFRLFRTEAFQRQFFSKRNSKRNLLNKKRVIKSGEKSQVSGNASLVIRTADIISEPLTHEQTAAYSNNEQGHTVVNMIFPTLLSSSRKNLLNKLKKKNKYIPVTDAGELSNIIFIKNLCSANLNLFKKKDAQLCIGSNHLKL